MGDERVMPIVGTRFGAVVIVGREASRVSFEMERVERLAPRTDHRVNSDSYDKGRALRGSFSRIPQHNR